MHLIVAEKNISARRIAAILAGHEKLRESRDAGVPVYRFDDCAVIGLRGHVVEVDFEEGYTNWRSREKTPRSLIDARTIKVPTEKRIVQLLQKLSRQADRVTIATDFDTEGELIGKEAYELIREVNPKVMVDRARFSAITPDEIRGAFAKTTTIDFDLAAAGEARQVIDLMWGASLTRFISLAARRGGANILSVGRVQSPTLAMIVDREKEIESFVPQTYWELSLSTEKDGEMVEARHQTTRFCDKEAATSALERTREPLVVTEVKEGTRTEKAPFPFDTTGFIVAAARLGFPAASAMRVAEDLYMNGYISYPRTDNTVYPATLDIQGILTALQSTEFAEDISWVMANRRVSPARGKKSSTDHPPIHPTSAATRASLGEERWKIYELVVRRFLATLSPDAQWRTMKVNFDAGGEPYTATGGQLTSPGWRYVYPYSSAKEYILPAMREGERLPIRQVDLEEKETQPPPRYSQSKLIQQMEELGLGTKSTRHEVIQKLLSRKYVEGTPLRPTLVGRAVTESLGNHADTITRPAMTRTLEEHMEQIKARKRTSSDVITESRGMLHAVFNQLEAHGAEIGSEIMEQTAEEQTLGPCPVCGRDLRIRQLRNQTQFIGCTGYPECSFNIGLPAAMWGKALRTDKKCPVHGLYHVRLVRKGNRPWEIGCPLCHHIESNREAFTFMPSLSSAHREALFAHHIYTVSELAGTTPGRLSEILNVSHDTAQTLLREAGDALTLLRRRTDCRKLVRRMLAPKKGRSPAKIIRQLQDAGINDVTGLAGADPAFLKKLGISEKESDSILREAKMVENEQFLRNAGIPAVSMKKYFAAGIYSPEDFLSGHPVWLSGVVGLSLDTVQRHVEMVARAKGQTPPVKYSKGQVARGSAELRSLPGMTEPLIGQLQKMGIISGTLFLAADPATLAAQCGIPEGKIKAWQAVLQEREKKARNDIIVI
ncbi:MAG TPA: DNA topoisomerase I [Methanoregulaceae archaeon]|nr:MAG: DNA topoisomerase I [Methanolinea sp.]HON81258.1 DNA topoisomerase I [Methanoregulaceae archaeon]HPD10136.1 DNA topoisomerase I [Methanoregulaceae archaeon]HRT15142.1 DNA topoisomerase I [Methanoregulaceae archaeon]HRU30741.1 DNA topoisomerase I [Methanoregulaceae archaeon]